MNGTEKERRLLTESKSKQYDVLNTRNPTDAILRLKAAADDGRAKFKRINNDNWTKSRELSSMMVKLLYVVKHSDGENPGEFDGMFIGEEFRGDQHPLLLIPSNEVSAIDADAVQEL